MSIPLATIRHITRVAQALGDPPRLRALMALRGGEMCVCAFIALLRLAPSTVSKHMQVLEQAGLITARKSGRRVYYRLPGRTAPRHLRAMLRIVTAALAQDPTILSDEKTLALIRKADVRKLAMCYRKRS